MAPQGKVVPQWQGDIAERVFNMGIKILTIVAEIVDQNDFVDEVIRAAIQDTEKKAGKYAVKIGFNQFRNNL